MIPPSPPPQNLVMSELVSPTYSADTKDHPPQVVYPSSGPTELSSPITVDTINLTPEVSPLKNPLSVIVFIIGFNVILLFFVKFYLSWLIFGFNVI